MQSENLHDERPLEAWEPQDDETSEQPSEDAPAAREHTERPPSEQPSSCPPYSGSRPPSFAELWGAACPQPRSLGRFFIAGALVLIIGAIGVPAYIYCNSMGLFEAHLPEFDTTDFGTPNRSKKAEWTEDLLAAQSEVPRYLDPVSAAAPAKARARAPAPTSAPKRLRTVVATGPEAAAPETPVLQPQSPYAALYGSSSRYAAANSGPSARGSSAPAPALVSSDAGRGSVVYARLKDQVASSPAGGEVIAALTHRAKVGKHVLSAGTEVHGQVTGADSSRVYVQFAFARLSDGSHLALQGTARDEQGRQGIPGTQPFDGKAAGSVGLASASRGVQAAGRELAGGLGAIVGSMLESATDSGASKAQRADRDEIVVIAKSGVPFRIYIQAIGESRAD